MAMLPGVHRLKQHILATTAGQQAEGISAGWQTAVLAEPPLLPCASPGVLPGLEIQEGGEEDDTVLIGSSAPSFCQPPPRPEQQQPEVTVRGDQQPHPWALHQQPQQLQAHAVPQAQQEQPQLSQLRTGTTHCLVAEDLHITARAATTNYGARCSSAGSMHSASSCSRDGCEAQEVQPEDLQQGRALHKSPAMQQQRPAGSDGLEEPLAASAPVQQQQQQQQQQQRAGLSSRELAILRQSLTDLQLDVQAPGELGFNEIPDQLVLQALSSRLGRLDSQKRRVLLEVLARIEDLGKANGGPDACRSSLAASSGSSEAAAEQTGPAASQPSTQSPPSSQRASTAGGAGLVNPGGQASAQPSAQHAVAFPDLPGDSPGQGAALPAPPGNGSQTTEAEPQHNVASMGADAAAAVAAPLPSDGPPSPSKAMSGKLAALRSRITSVAGRQQPGFGEIALGASSPSPAAVQSAAVPAAPAADQGLAPGPQRCLQQQLAQQPLRLSPSLPAPGLQPILASGKLYPMVQERHCERSRLSGNGLRGRARQLRLPRPDQGSSHLSPANSLAGFAADDALSTFAADHLAQKHPEAVVAAGPAPSSPGCRTGPLASTGSALAGSQELVKKPSGLDLVTAASQCPHSARGQLPRTATLLVLPQTKWSTAHKPQTEKTAPATSQASQNSPAAASAAACSPVSTESIPGGVSTAYFPITALLYCRELTLVLLDTWGDRHFVGLSGLQLLGPGGQPLLLGPDQLFADPPDLNCFPGHSGESMVAVRACDDVEALPVRAPGLLHHSAVASAKVNTHLLECTSRVVHAAPMLFPATCRRLANRRQTVGWMQQHS